MGTSLKDIERKLAKPTFSAAKLYSPLHIADSAISGPFAAR